MDGIAHVWDAASAVRLKWDSAGRSDNVTAATPTDAGPSSKGKHQWLMRKTFTRDSLEGYFRTWSALHAYHEANPDDAAKKGRGEQGDIVDRLMAEIWAGKQQQIGPAEDGLGREVGQRDGSGDTIEGAWPLVLMMIKKKA
jgi:hypothetical protein